MNSDCARSPIQIWLEFLDVQFGCGAVKSILEMIISKCVPCNYCVPRLMWFINEGQTYVLLPRIVQRARPLIDIDFLSMAVCRPVGRSALCSIYTQRVHSRRSSAGSVQEAYIILTVNRLPSISRLRSQRALDHPCAQTTQAAKHGVVPARPSTDNARANKARSYSNGPKHARTGLSTHSSYTGTYRDVKRSHKHCSIS